jgi:peptide/nickel transport system permease protein
VDLQGIHTAGDLIGRINQAPDNRGRLTAGITQWQAAEFCDSQFFLHLKGSVTFQARSLKDNRKLTEIISERAPLSLAVQIPAFALEWMIGLAIACFVAYYRESLIDQLGVFLTVLGMCIPFLAFMIYGQWVMFELSPRHAFGIYSKVNVYVPIAIMVVAGLGSQVRFYRTIILDETNRDYVRTARAKGLPLTSVLFKHVLKNCMLPILTSLILTIPFLIMGSLLVETYFGIAGLGDLMITSIMDRNEPIMNGLVFLTALIYTVGLLLTDISYAIFDPRIRLR